MDETTISIDADVSAAADVAREYGHHAGRSWFAGVTADHPDRTLTVYRVAHSDFDVHMRALVPADIDVVFIDAAHSRDELQVARERVWDLAPELTIEAVAVPVDGSVLTVVVTGIESDAQTVLDRVVPGMASAQTGTTITV